MASSLAKHRNSASAPKWADTCDMSFERSYDSHRLPFLSVDFRKRSGLARGFLGSRDCPSLSALRESSRAAHRAHQSNFCALDFQLNGRLLRQNRSICSGEVGLGNQDQMASTADGEAPSVEQSQQDEHTHEDGGICEQHRKPMSASQASRMTR